MRIFTKHQYLALPLFVFFCFSTVLDWNGPFYLGSNLDPDYAYLHNSLAIGTGRVPGHWDHPGTTLQALGGLTLSFATAGLSAAESEFKVLSDPERYARLISLVIFSLFCVSLAFSGWLVRRQTGRQLLALLFQALPLTTLVVWSALPKLSPDILTMSLSMVFLAVLLSDLQRNEASPGGKKVYLLAILAGLIFTTKITGLPLLFIPLWLYRKRISMSMKYVLVGGLTFLAFEAAVMRELLPNFFWYFFRWIFSIVVHKEKYGSGETGIPDFSALGASLWQVATFTPWLTLIFVLALGAIITSRFSNNSAKPTPLPTMLVLVGLSLLQYLMIAKHPGPRYLIPQIPVTAVLLVLLFWNRKIPAVAGERAQNILLGAVCGISVLFAAAIPIKMKFDHAPKLYLASAQALADKVKEEGCQLITFYRASTLEYAVSFGNSFSRSQFTETLSVLYPGFVSFEPGTGFFDIGHRHLRTEEVLKGKDGAPKNLCFQGLKDLAVGTKPIPGYQLSLLMNGAHEEALFKLELERSENDQK